MSDIFDMLEKAKALHKEIDGDGKAKRECKSYIANNISRFYKEASPTQFVEVLNFYKDCFKDRESNIVDILKSKSIPYILGYVSYTGEITKEIIEIRAYDSYKNDDLIDSLEYIKLLTEKFTLGLNMYILKGDILRSLGGYNGAIEAYQCAREFKSLDFIANTRILQAIMMKYKKELIISVAIILTVTVGQFILFDTGVIGSRLYNFNLEVNDGKYVMNGEDIIIIPPDEKVRISIYHDIMPFYGYEGQVQYRVIDESIAKLDRNNNLIGIIEGSTKLEVIRNDKVVHSYEVVVAKSEIEHINISIDKELSQVGDIGKIESQVIRNYDFNQENKVTYSSSNKKVLKVDKDGVVEVVGAGKASIIATCEGFTAEEEFIINLVVEDIKVDYDVELQVADSYQLKVEVITNTDIKNKPQVMFSLEETTEPIISIDKYGKIKGLIEGMQIVNISCANIQKSVMVTVKAKDITKYQIKNLTSTSKIVNEYLDVDITWESIGLTSSDEYEVYTKYDEDGEFEKIVTTTGDKTSCNFKFNLEDFDGNGSIDIYVVGKNSQGESKKSNTETIKFAYQNPNKSEVIE